MSSSVANAPEPTTTAGSTAADVTLSHTSGGTLDARKEGIETVAEQQTTEMNVNAMAKEQAQIVYRARLAEQVERFDEMSRLMKQAALFGAPLRVEERNLLSVAYKNSVGERRSTWRIISAIENKQREKGEEALAALAGQFRRSIEKELNSICEEVLDLLESRLLKDALAAAKARPSESAAEACVFYYKMQGDYFRYIAEFMPPELREGPKSRAEAAYRAGFAVAADLQSVNPIRLGLILNYSVFYYEIMNEPEEACSLAQGAFDEAVLGLDTASENTYRDAALIMQLLRDNLTLWAQEAQKPTELVNGSATSSATATGASAGAAPATLAQQPQETTATSAAPASPPAAAS